MRKLIGTSIAVAMLAGTSLVSGIVSPTKAFAACPATTPGNTSDTCTIAATITLNQGSLSLQVPTLNAFKVGSQTLQLNGADQTATAGWAGGVTKVVGAFQIVDATGTGAGWHLTLGAPQFTCGTNAGCQNNDKLPFGELTGGAFQTATCANYTEQHCGSGRGLNPGTYSGAGTTAIDNNLGTGGVNSPVEEVSAGTNTGMGSYDVSLSNLSLYVPADAYASTYTTTITATLANNP